MTQTDYILRHLRKFGSISPREALEDYGVMRLAARIKDLRDAGYSITSTMRTHQLTGKKYARYTLEA